MAQFHPRVRIFVRQWDAPARIPSMGSTRAEARPGAHGPEGCGSGSASKETGFDASPSERA
jgi:hypothetical protein